MAKTGRKTKLCPEVADKILLAIRSGNYSEMAAAYAGIGKSTYYQWLKRGAVEKDGPFREFADDVAEALAYAECRNVGIISAASKKSWQAAAWLVERKYPDRWGKRTVIQVGTGEGKTQEINLDNFTDEEIDILENLMKKGRTTQVIEPEKT